MTQPRWRPVRRRTAVLLGLSAVVAVAVPLLLARAETVVVKGEVRTSSLAFTLAAPAAVGEDADLDWILAEGLRAVGEGDRLNPGPPGGRVSFLDTLAGQGALRLSRLRLPGGMRVQLTLGSGPRFVEMAFTCDSLCDEVQVDANGRHFRRTEQSAAMVDGTARYLLYPGTGTVSLLLRPARGETLQMGTHLSVVNPSFARNVEMGRNVVERETRLVSGISGGYVELPEFDDRRHQLSPGALLGFNFDNVTIDALSTMGDTMIVTFSGTAKEISMSSGTSVRRLVPRRIEWLYSQKHLMLVLMGVAALITLAATARALVGQNR